MKPILFSTPMVQAILDGRKTMTRRVIKENNKMEQITLDRLCGICGFFDQETMNYGCTHKECGETGEDINGKEHGRCFSWSCPFGQEWGYEIDCESSFDGDTYMNIPIPSYQVGDVLWVRETFGITKDRKTLCYRADFTETDVRVTNTIIKWKPSIFMPKEACRIFLRITNVRVEKLQDINDDDAYNECGQYPINEHGENFAGEFPIEVFENIWNSTAKEGYKWEDNPYVFVYEFQRICKPN